MKFFEPKRLKEANLQAELYHRLKEIDIPCYLEYPFIDFTNNRRRRADAAIYKNGKIVCLVEMKSRRTPRAPNWKGKQLQAYRTTGVYVISCDNFNFEESLQKIVELYENFV